jgi:hypothetical protein
MRREILFFNFVIIFLNSILIFSEEIKPKIKLIYGKWGDKPGEFGLIPEKGSPTGDMEEAGEGPNDFYVDENDFIYVLDNVNKRVQVFDKEGKFVRIDNALFEEVAKMGVTRRVIIDGRETEVYVGWVFDKTPRWEKEKPQYWGCRVRKKEINGYWIPENGIYIQELILPNNKKIQLYSDTKKSFGFSILGKDRNNYVYIGIFVDRGLYPEILKINEKEGKIVGKVKISTGFLPYYYTTSKIRLSPRGDIYVMVADETGFWIDYYPTELFDKPEGRDFTYIYEKENKKMLEILEKHLK